MNKRKKTTISVVAALLSLIFASTIAAAEKQKNIQSEQLPAEDVQRFTTAIGQIKNYYVKEVEDKQIFENAIRGMLEGLDPHSAYLDEEDFKDLQVSTQGEFGGLGIEITMEDGLVKVVSPIDDTPAQKAGVQAGDLIARIDKVPVKGMTLREAVSKMRGKKGTAITLTILRKGETKPLRIDIVRDVIQIQSVKSRMIDKEYGYVRISHFQAPTAKNMRDEFKKRVIDTLAKRVGVRCSNPGCRKLTSGPRNESHQIINIGVAAHITAASPGGPRYNPNLSPEDRISPDNGIWLCQNCAKLVDNDPNRYTVAALCDWKARSEDAALSEIEGLPSKPSDIPDCFAEIELSYKRVKIRSERHDYLLEVTLSNLGVEPISGFHVDLEFPTRVIENIDENTLYIENRSNFDTSFFRVVHRSDGNEIYPGDSEVIISLPYYMVHEIYYSRGYLFQHMVRVTFYQTGYHPLLVERPFGELQIF